MESLATKECAAVALSKALSDHGIRHAYIGGFAVNLLGSQRATEDIDVLIDLPRDTIRPRVQEATAHDARFELRGLSFVFEPGSSLPVVPIETLHTGDLGLPRSIDAMLVGNERHLPILQPGLLVLTKAKRCVCFLESTRPKSLAKLASDIEDIAHLLHWLIQHGKMLDFAGYDVPDSGRERVYSAVRELAHYWRLQGQTDHMLLLEETLTVADRELVLGSLLRFVRSR